MHFIKGIELFSMEFDDVIFRIFFADVSVVEIHYILTVSPSLGLACYKNIISGSCRNLGSQHFSSLISDRNRGYSLDVGVGQRESNMDSHFNYVNESGVCML